MSKRGDFVVEDRGFDIKHIVAGETWQEATA